MLTAYCVCNVCALQRMCCHDSLCIHTCTGHLWRVGVRAVVAIATDTVSCSLAGGSAVNGALETLVVSLCILEEACYASCEGSIQQ